MSENNSNNSNGFKKVYPYKKAKKVKTPEPVQANKPNPQTVKDAKSFSISTKADLSKDSFKVKKGDEGDSSNGNSIMKIVSAFRPEIRTIINNSEITFSKLGIHGVELKLKDGHRIHADAQISSRIIKIKGSNGKGTGNTISSSTIQHRYKIWNPDGALILNAVR